MRRQPEDHGTQTGPLMRLACVIQTRISAPHLPAQPATAAARALMRSISTMASQAWQIWQPHHFYLSAAAVFFASRLVVVTGLKFGAFVTPNSISGKWDAGTFWYHRLLRWDAGWYASITANGYKYNVDTSVQSSTVFYPGYPLASYLVKSTLHISHHMALLVVANLAAFVSALLLARLVKDEHGDGVALLAVAFYCFFPASLFLSAGYAESLFFVFCLSSLLFMTERRFALAAICAGLAVGTRSTGLVLAPVLILEMWRTRQVPLPRLLPQLLVCGTLAVSGLLLYMAYLGWKFGNPLAFATGQAAWHKGTFAERFYSAISLLPLRSASIKLSGLFIVFVGLAAWSFWRLRTPLALFALGALMLPYFTLGITPSTGRYVYASFPAFIVLALFCKDRQWIATFVIAISAVLLFKWTALFSQWHWVG